MPWRKDYLSEQKSRQMPWRKDYLSEQNSRQMLLGKDYLSEQNSRQMLWGKDYLSEQNSRQMPLGECRYLLVSSRTAALSLLMPDDAFGSAISIFFTGLSIASKAFLSPSRSLSRESKTTFTF